MKAEFALDFTATPDSIDELGHVNNAVWVQWIQAVATAHWLSVAPPAHQQAYVWVVVRHEIDYRGNLKVGANSTMVFELTGTNNSRALTTGRVDYDTVLVYGNMILNGLFDVSLGSTFTPSVGNRFELASTTGSITWSGTLGLHLSLPALTAGQSWSTTVESGGLLGGQSLFVTVVPAPGATALLATAALIGNGRRRR